MQTVQQLPIHLALAFDQGFVNPFYVFLSSVFENNSQNEIIFHVIISDITTKQKNQITSYVLEKKGKINFYEIDNSYKKYFIIPNDMKHFTIETYYRLLFPKLISENIKRLLYIDADTLVVGDLTQLYNIDLYSKPVAAVVDPGMTLRPELGITEPGCYFNAGVMVLDLNKWQEYQITENAFKFLEAHPEKVIWVDQDVLNAVLINKWQKINSSYNLMKEYIPLFITSNKLKELISKTIIIHFNGPKPWDVKCDNKLRFLYNRYFRLSPISHQGIYGDGKPRGSDIYNILLFKIKDFYFKNPRIAPIWNKLKNVISKK